MPIKEYGFALDKQSFWNCIFLRYHIPLQCIPTTCSCGCAFNAQHALTCPKGGFIINRYNELRDLTAEILDEICSDVKIEPLLQPKNGEIFSKRSTIRTDDARADVAARGFWTRGQMAFVDVNVFNPLAKCHRNQTLEAVHRKNENDKKRNYNDRIINVHHGSFTPLVFSCYGGMSRECSRFYTHAAELLSEKRKLPKGFVSCWLKTRLNFSLIRSCLLCIRGTRSIYDKTKTVELTDIVLAVHDSHCEEV